MHNCNKKKKIPPLILRLFQSCFTKGTIQTPGRRPGFLACTVPMAETGMKGHTSSGFPQAHRLLNCLLSKDKYAQMKSCFPSKISLFPLLNKPVKCLFARYSKYPAHCISSRHVWSRLIHVKHSNGHGKKGTIAGLGY